MEWSWTELLLELARGGMLRIAPFLMRSGRTVKIAQGNETVSNTDALVHLLGDDVLGTAFVIPFLHLAGIGGWESVLSGTRLRSPLTETASGRAV